MALVGYSDSEESDQEKPAPPPTKPKPKANPNKPSIQKFVDPSNPNKIQVDLTSIANQAADEVEESERPIKKAKTGPSSFNSFNSFLPAPKKASASGNAVSGSTKKGLGGGFRLKTGSEPAFSREGVLQDPSNQERDQTDTDGQGAGPEPATEAQTNIDGAETASSDPVSTANTSISRPVDSPPKKKSTIFMPLSVARKPQKKSIPPTAAQNMGKSKQETTVPQPAQPIFLFSTPSNIENQPEESTRSNGTYEPLLYQEPTAGLDASSSPSAHSQQPYPSDSNGTAQPSINANSLDSIATDLNLSASAKRQLLGRNARNATAAPISVVNFNTDQEYATNEALRQAGDTVQHNPVRAIAPGKHSLKQLMNAATSQKDALEEHFAAGKRNRSEAGSKYGW